MLSKYRVLDLTDEKGFLCGKIMGDLGADVIKIEKPGGDNSRRIGPFFHNTVDPERGLNWFALNASKRGITLNLEDARGKEIFMKLADTADVVIESFSAGCRPHNALSPDRASAMAALGLPGSGRGMAMVGRAW